MATAGFLERINLHHSEFVIRYSTFALYLRLALRRHPHTGQGEGALCRSGKKELIAG
jgi:hypothetical protein